MRAALTLGPGSGRSFPIPGESSEPPPVLYLNKAGDPGAHVDTKPWFLASTYRLAVDDDGQPRVFPNGDYAYEHVPEEGA